MPARHARPKPAGRWAIPVAAACVAVAASASGPLPWLMIPAAAAATFLGLRQADRRAQQALAAAGRADERVRAAEAGADSWRAEADFLSAELAALTAELAASTAELAASTAEPGTPTAEPTAAGTPLPAMSEPWIASSGDFVAHVAAPAPADLLEGPAVTPSSAEPVLEIRLPDTPISAPPITSSWNPGAQSLGSEPFPAASAAPTAASQPAGWQGVRVIDLVVRETRVTESAA